MAKTMRSLGAAALVVAAVVGRADAAEIHVISAGAVRSIVTDLSEAFKRETGHTVTLSFGTMGVVRNKLASGAPADVVIMTDTALEEMIRQGAIRAGSRTDIGRTAIGVAVREGATAPDISTPDALKKALLAARSLTYVDPAQGATSGIHFAGVLDRLGIADAVKAKTTLVPGGYPAELVAKGEVEMVAHQISEIVPVKGVRLVGPLPRELQKLTVYSSGIAVASTSPETAKAFVDFVTQPTFREKFTEAGLNYQP
jgi:molybdate transport system substrate-binding protein